MNTNRRNISILGVVTVVSCLFFSREMKKARNSVAMDMDMVRFGPSVNCACDTNIRYSDSDDQE